MHVLVTADTVGGVWTYTRELVSELSRRGIRVTLVSFGEIPSPAETRWMEGLQGLDYRPTAFRLEWMRDSEDDLAASAAYLLSIVDEVKPDLLHLSQFYYGSLKCEQPRIVVAHSDIVSWWQAVHKAEPKQEKDKWIRWYRAMVSRAVERADSVVAPSQWMLGSLSHNYGFPKMGAVVYNGRNPSLFDPYVSKEEYAVSVGRIWDFGKNAALLRKIDSPLPIHLAGSNQEPNRPATADQDDDHGEEAPRNSLILTGVQTENQLRQLYSRASIYIATSQYEPFGLAPVEAALSRCAIVASDIPSFREIWGDAVSYFTSNNTASLEAALQRLQADKELCASFGQLAYQRARQRYTSSRMVEDYLHLYEALVLAEVNAA
jgi:glycogen(starch) synthase